MRTMPFAASGALALALVRCQCLQPVVEMGDAGGLDGATDAAIDAGLPSCRRAEDCPGPFAPCQDGSSCGCGTFRTCMNGRCVNYSRDGCDDAGLGDGGCQSARDCAGSRPSVRYCQAMDAGGYSCVSRGCLWECQGGRTCSIDADAGCLACSTPPTVACPRTPCTAEVRDCAGSIEESTCATFPGTTLQMVGMSVGYYRDTSCQVTLGPCGGALLLGRWSDTTSLESVAHFPALGGWCTVQQLPTGAPRYLFNCPSCQFVLRM